MPTVLATPPCSAHRLQSWGRSPLATGLRPFGLPRSYAAGCFLCTGWRVVHKKHNIPRRAAPPPAALAYGGGARRPFTLPANFGFIGFCEVRHNGVLGSSGYSTPPVLSPDGPPTLGNGHGALPSQRRCPSALVSLRRVPDCRSRSGPRRAPRPRPRSPDPPPPS
jgi:hypothetical protein